MELPSVEVGLAALAVEGAGAGAVMEAVGSPMKQLRRRSELSFYILPLVAHCSNNIHGVGVCRCVTGGGGDSTGGGGEARGGGGVGGGGEAIGGGGGGCSIACNLDTCASEYPCQDLFRERVKGDWT